MDKGKVIYLIAFISLIIGILGISLWVVQSTLFCYMGSGPIMEPFYKLVIFMIMAYLGFTLISWGKKVKENMKTLLKPIFLSIFIGIFITLFTGMLPVSHHEITASWFAGGWPYAWWAEKLADYYVGRVGFETEIIWILFIMDLIIWVLITVQILFLIEKLVKEDKPIIRQILKLISNKKRKITFFSIILIVILVLVGTVYIHTEQTKREEKIDFWLWELEGVVDFYDKEDIDTYETTGDHPNLQTQKILSSEIEEYKLEIKKLGATAIWDSNLGKYVLK